MNKKITILLLALFMLVGGVAHADECVPSGDGRPCLESSAQQEQKITDVFANLSSIGKIVAQNYAVFWLIVALLLSIIGWWIFGLNKKLSTASQKNLATPMDLHDYIKRLIPVHLTINDFLKKIPTSKELKDIKELAWDALDSCGVEIFEPAIGEDYRRAYGISEDPKTQKTDNPKEQYKISKVLEVGYKIRTDTGYKVIYKSRVCIFEI